MRCYLTRTESLKYNISFLFNIPLFEKKMQKFPFNRTSFILNHKICSLPICKIHSIFESDLVTSWTSLIITGGEIKKPAQKQ